MSRLFKSNLILNFKMHSGLLIILTITTPLASSSGIDDGLTESKTDDHFRKQHQNEMRDLKESVQKLENKLLQVTSKLKSENEDQNEEIAMLKNAKKSQNMRLGLMQSEIEHLQTENLNQTIKIRHLERTIAEYEMAADADAVKALRGSNKNQPKFISSPSSRLPTSCRDLSSNGHQFNGIYQVYDSANQKILVIFCDFMNGGKVTGKTIGSVAVKSLPKGIYFNAERTEKFAPAAPLQARNTGIIVKYQKAPINLGGGMNSTTGIFKAPKAGIYYFSFNGPYGMTKFDLHLRHNEKSVALTSSGHRFGNDNSFQAIVNNNGQRPMSLGSQTMLKLARGDRVDLVLANNSAIIARPAYNYVIQFAGWLEDEFIVTK